MKAARYWFGPHRLHFDTNAGCRFATFDYKSTGRLVRITDVVGMQSSFGYGLNDFISTLTTPYGTTTFSRLSRRRDHQFRDGRGPTKTKRSRLRSSFCRVQEAHRRRTNILPLADFKSYRKPNRAVFNLSKMFDRNLNSKTLFVSNKRKSRLRSSRRIKRIFRNVCDRCSRDSRNKRPSIQLATCAGFLSAGQHRVCQPHSSSGPCSETPF